MRYAFLGVVAILLFTGCADSVEYTLADEREQVGFWYGLWHGMIVVISFIVSLFDDNVSTYAVYNNGGWYDFGFIIGIISVWGGGCQVKCKSSADKKRDKEWEEIGSKVEVKVMHKLKEWAEDEETTENDEEWDDISEKVEKKLKRKIREWAEKD